MNNILRLLVISDLHAISDKKFSDDSRLDFTSGTCEFAEEFIEYAKNLNYEIDYLICSGDISNKADKKSFLLGWELIKEIKEKLGIGEILCVPGNHDHISRAQDSHTFDPKHYMQYIKPNFPINDYVKSTHFWAWNWCHLEDEKVNSILLNSSAYHGYGDEHRHGRISQETITRIKDYISSPEFPEKDLNILVCHHHPYKMEHLENDLDKECMDGGDSLGNVLIESEKGPWLIVHGHKHIPQIRYAPSPSTMGPLVFSAGSFSAKLYTNILDRTSNQFYVINVDLEKTKARGVVVGTFESFEWTPLKRWSRSTAKFLPARGGFGGSKTPREIAVQINKHLESSNDGFLNTSDLSSYLDDLLYFTPLDKDIFDRELERMNLVPIYENYTLTQVGRKNV